MKKLLLIAAALTTMVSCSKTQVIPEETQQQEIAMKAFNQTAVKATGPISGTSFSEDYNAELMRVYGFYSSDESTYALYFTANYMYQTVNSVTAWMGWSGTAHKPYYWPSTGNMKFIAVFPIDYEDYVVTDGGESTHGSISYTGANTTISQIDLSDFTKQKDIMYSYNLYSEPVACSSLTGKQTLTFNHLLSQVVVNVKSTVANLVKLEDVTLVGAEVKGTITIPSARGTADYTYRTDPNDQTVSLSQGNVSYDLLPAVTNNFIGTSFTAVSSNGALVLPSKATNSTNLSISYTIDGGSTITKSVPLTDVWVAGKKYIYNVTITMNEIIFDTAVVDWAEGTVTTQPSI